MYEFSSFFNHNFSEENSCFKFVACFVFYSVFFLLKIFTKKLLRQQEEGWVFGGYQSMCLIWKNSKKGKETSAMWSILRITIISVKLPKLKLFKSAVNKKQRRKINEIRKCAVQMNSIKFYVYIFKFILVSILGKKLCFNCVINFFSSSQSFIFLDI